jgi:hypothetical protein
LAYIPGLLHLSDQVRIEPSITRHLDEGVTRVVDTLNVWRWKRLP